MSINKMAIPFNMVLCSLLILSIMLNGICCHHDNEGHKRNMEASFTMTQKQILKTDGYRASTIKTCAVERSNISSVQGKWYGKSIRRH